MKQKQTKQKQMVEKYSLGLAYYVQDITDNISRESFSFSKTQKEFRKCLNEFSQNLNE